MSAQNPNAQFYGKDAQPAGAPPTSGTEVGGGLPLPLVNALKAEQAKHATESPWVAKLIGLLIDLLTGQPADISESGNYSKTQTVQILGTTYTLTETLNGSIEIKATPQ